MSETEPLRSAPDTLSSRHAQATSPEQPPVTEAWRASKTLLPLPPPTLSLPKPGGQTLPFQGLNPWRSFSHSCSFNAGPSPLPPDGYGRALRTPTARLSHPRRRHLSKTQSRRRGPENEPFGNREASVPLAIWPPHSTWTAQRPCRAPVTPARARPLAGSGSLRPHFTPTPVPIAGFSVTVPLPSLVPPPSRQGCSPLFT